MDAGVFAREVLDELSESPAPLKFPVYLLFGNTGLAFLLFVYALCSTDLTSDDFLIASFYFGVVALSCLWLAKELRSSHVSRGAKVSKKKAKKPSRASRRGKKGKKPAKKPRAGLKAKARRKTSSRRRKR